MKATKITTNDVLVLGVLLNGEHSPGDALQIAVMERFDVLLGTSELNSSLRSMHAKKLITSKKCKPNGGYVRLVYRITADGRKALRELQEFCKLALKED